LGARYIYGFLRAVDVDQPAPLWVPMFGTNLQVHKDALTGVRKVYERVFTLTPARSTVWWIRWGLRGEALGQYDARPDVLAVTAPVFCVARSTTVINRRLGCEGLAIDKLWRHSRGMCPALHGSLESGSWRSWLGGC
jgi:hypothetical protein